MNFDFSYIKIMLEVLWWIITNFPGVIVPFTIACIIAGVFHLSKNQRNLIESILELFF